MEERADGAVDAEGVLDGPSLDDVVIEADKDHLALQVRVLDQRQIAV